MDAHPIPLLTEDASRFDWRRARYEAEVSVSPTRAVVRHRLREAPTLQGLVEQGLARWAVEVRCPKTLYARVEAAASAEQDVRWTRDGVDGEVFVMPGLLAVRSLSFQPAEDELNPVWDARRIAVPRGWWLARGAPRRTGTLAQSLLRFVRGKNLADGEMRVECVTATDEVRFDVHLADDVWDERANRHVQVAALIGALARMPGHFPGDGESDEPRIVQEIRHRLEESSVPVWSDGAEYDPARAATIIEPFHPAPDPEGTT